jgi:hypothetical protein
VTTESEIASPAAPAPSRVWRRIRIGCWIGIPLALLCAVAVFWFRWSHLGPIGPSGGLYFPKRVELSVPAFQQGDPRWSDDLLGPTDGTLGGEGCAVASAAMVMAFYGVDTDPQRLNGFLNDHDGFTPEGWIYWEKAADLASDHVRKAYEDLPSYRLIDWNLMHGNPVIVRLRLASGMNHFVVIAGKDGFDYLTRDPASFGLKGIYPLKERGSHIYALRYYEKF